MYTSPTGDGGRDSKRHTINVLEGTKMEFIIAHMLTWLALSVLLGAIGFGSQLLRISKMSKGDVSTSFSLPGLLVTFGGILCSGVFMLLFVISAIGKLVLGG